MSPRRFALEPKEFTLKKLLASIALTAALAATSAYAWHPITIYNRTDPVLVHKVVFSHPNQADISYTLDVPGGGWRTFGPLPEGGPCYRWVNVDVISSLGEASARAPAQMNVCTETTIIVTGVWPTCTMHTPGCAPLVISHH